MKKLFAMAVPVLPNQTEHMKKFANALKGERFEELKKSRIELGVRERSFLQHTPMGDFVIVTLEGENPEQAFAKFGQGQDAFTKWFMNEVKEIHGLDLTSPPDAPLPELIIDSGELSAATA
jgi:hypothetical protein